MRESNFAFPAQNKACVLITSTLYDRRALDTTSPLPLLNSLTHLTYLTSTSPRIREILTCDGGLERLVRLLRDFCIAPPPPENPALIFGLSLPTIPRPLPVPTLNPKSFDRHAAFRFSLAFQCVVNIGVRGSESIRRRVVEAGTLDVVGCVLESWLTSKGFAVGPSASASGLPRETREQRALRRQQQVEQRQREQAQELARLLTMERQFTNMEADDDDSSRRGSVATSNSVIEDDDTSRDQSISTSDAETSVSSDTSANVTPLGSGTPTGSVVVPGRDRSGTLMGRPIWDDQPTRADLQHHHIHHNRHQARTISRSRTVRAQHNRSHDPPTDTTPSSSNSRPDTETEDDADGDPDPDGDIEMSHNQENDPPRHHQHRQPLHIHTHPRRTVGIVADSPSPTAAAGGGRGALGSEPLDVVDLDAHIIINTDQLGDDAVRDAGGLMAAGVEEGIVALDQNVNDDLAMGAPPGAPGAIDATPRTRNRGLTVATVGRTTGTGREEMTPRAVLASLPPFASAPPPMPIPVSMSVAAAVGGGGGGVGGPPGVQPSHALHRDTAAMNQEARIPILDGPPPHTNAGGPAFTTRTHTPTAAALRHAHHHRHHHHHHHLEESGPFREDEVLLSLQLLAYLSKYPHVRQAFYKPRVSFHPATAALYSGSTTSSASADASGLSMAISKSGSATPSADTKESSFFNFKTITGRGKEKAGLFSSISPTASTSTSMSQNPQSGSPSSSSVPQQQQHHQRVTNVFSLVERFTFRPSPTESNLAHPPPFLPPEIQYWAGVIMRNACRKDESRGGIRQCANMLCGKWESFPREFAKCRRCRKAKYCGKECQSRAWSEGHRFWCSAREGEDNLDGPTTTATTTASSHTGHSRHTHQQIVGLGDGAGEDVEQQQQQQQQHNPANANNNTRNGQLNVALAARLQRREERERARQQMAAAAAAAMASIPPARLANAIRQRTQAANAAAAVNTSANANGGAGTSAASHVEEGHVGEAADRERRRGEHHLHARTVMRGRMLRTAMNEGDGERSRGSAGSANGESSSGGEGSAERGGAREQDHSTTAAVETSNGERVRYMTDATRMQLQETMARMYARRMGGTASSMTVGIGGPAQAIELMTIPNVNMNFAHPQQQQQRQHQGQLQLLQQLTGNVDMDLLFANAPGRPRAETMPLPISLPALQQQQQHQNIQHHTFQLATHPMDIGPLRFSPFGHDLSQAGIGNINVDVDVDVADAASFTGGGGGDVDLTMRDGEERSIDEVVNLTGEDGDMAIGIVGEDGSVTRTMREEDPDRMVLG